MKFYQYILGFATLCAAGCTSGFESFNTPEHNPTTLPATASFPTMIDCMSSAEENPCQRNNTFWACFGGYVTAPNSWSRSQLYSTYNIDDSWNEWSVNYYFTTFYPAWFQVKRLTDGEGYYYQMAQLMRVYVMQMVASLQGPLPYSQIKDGDLYIAYDDETTAWHAMFDDLDVAIAEIQSAATSGDMPLSSVDRVYGGDNSKWLKFANTLKLRMAMRISNAEPEYAQQKAEEAVAAGVMTSTSDSAYDDVAGRYPNGYYQVSTGWGSYEVKANACITSYMNGYNDPRRAAYFTEQAHNADGGYMGVRSGIAGCIPSTFQNYSGTIFEASDGQTKPMPIMYAAEAAFLRAEGALKGWNMGGTAKEFYEEGIRLSFEEWGVSGADDYMSDDTLQPGSYTDAGDSSNSITNRSKITIAWDSVSDDEKHLEQIITQKWLANYLNSLEAWSDFRRTGYPYIFPPKDNLSGGECSDERGQRRLRFTLNEYTNNTANVRAAVQMLGAKRDGDGVDLYWALQSGSKY